jgi:hypothetical protein
MATYEVDVEGATYEVDAPDEATAWKWAVATHRQSQPAGGVISSKQMPVESGTMLATPIEYPAQPQQPQQPALPLGGTLAEAATGDSLDTVRKAMAGDAGAITDVALGTAAGAHEQNLAAAALRGAAPTAVGAGAGALIGGGIGSLAGGVGAIPGAIIGARVGPMALEGADLLTAGVNQMFKTNFTTPSEAVQHLLTQYGVPQSVTGAEQLTEAGARGTAGMLGGIGLGKQLATSAAPTVAKIGRFLSAGPVGQTIAGTAGALASEEARQQGAGMGGQIAAGLAGAVVPGAMVSGAKAIGAGVKEYFTPSGHITKALQQAGSRVPVLNTRATEEIAKAFGADPELRQAATALGLDVENMSPALLSKNPQAQSIYFGVQSARGSQTGMQVAADVQALKEKALDLAEKWGAKDLSELNIEMRKSMESTVDKLRSATKKIYDEELPKVIPARTPVPEGAAVAFAKQKLANLNGNTDLLSTLDRLVLSLAEGPAKSAATEAAKREASFLAARNGTTIEQELAKMNLPTPAQKKTGYFEYDEVRKKAGAKTQGQSIFTDTTTGEAKNYYKLLTQDQNAVAEALGHKGLVEQGKALVQQRKALEDQMTDLFGKQLEKSFVTKALRPALSVISKADSDKLVNLINTIPKEFRQDVIVSGLTSMFSRANSDGVFNPKLFANFMSGLEKNSVAKTAIFSNLPAETKKEINALAMLSKNYVEGLSLQIGTGALAEALKTKASAFQKVANYVLTYKGGLLGILGNHFLNAKAAPLQAADELLSSRPFLEMVKASKADPSRFAPAAEKVVSSSAFKKFADAANIPAAARSTFFTLDQDQPQQESK